MLSHVSKIFQLLSRSFIVASDWGVSAVWPLVYGSRLGKGEASVPLKMGAEKRRFFFRRQVDRPVLSQLSADFGIICPQNGAAIKTIVDAGANIGVFSAIARKLYPNARIVAVEIEPRNLVVLRQNAASLGISSVREAALWSETGRVELISATHPQAHTVTSLAQNSSSASVASISLKDLLDAEGIETLDILKMDIEGAEYMVMHTLDDDTLARINAIRFECNDSDLAGNAMIVLSRLQHEDFDAYAFDENLYLIRRRTGWRFMRHYSGIGEIPSFL